MKAYKIIATDPAWHPETPYKVGRLFFKMENGEVLLLATPVLPQHFVFNDTIDRFIKKGYVEEVDLIREHWVHPHLYKPIQLEVRKTLSA